MLNCWESRASSNSGCERQSERKCAVSGHTSTVRAGNRGSTWPARNQPAGSGAPPRRTWTLPSSATATTVPRPSVPAGAAASAADAFGCVAVDDEVLELRGE